MSVAIDFRLMCGSCLLDKFLDVRFEPIGQVFIHVYNSCTRAFVCRVKRMQQDWTTLAAFSRESRVFRTSRSFYRFYYCCHIFGRVTFKFRVCLQPFDVDF